MLYRNDYNYEYKCTVKQQIRNLFEEQQNKGLTPSQIKSELKRIYNGWSGYFAVKYIVDKWNGLAKDKIKPVDVMKAN